MMAAGVRVFAGGLHPASSARSLRAQPTGNVLINDGPYLETKEHVGGFWILEAANLGPLHRRGLEEEVGPPPGRAHGRFGPFG
jgi:hypothetical protein